MAVGLTVPKWSKAAASPAAALFVPGPLKVKYPLGGGHLALYVSSSVRLLRVVGRIISAE